ncbi:acyl-CoA oxidase domain protein [Gordonia bronchialis DSM 43247]|uniref:acyl-CoA oxidase n=1 Tax=Gordonia bronchialis (strain ATCC 25592 / DSM 43247 / BCRC 13721 / JCM 3198 / KCTC 3076 / NBRC 16047 / NCTC 10667) TaxID=526226 RepID=D0L4A9_GORB4|nr:acyl-CoA dehydrogenase [Gordonia bronchialis]ACY20333.1 acyl-CoA oxidase domain protein [Gordonia bronchialis DSM 43247]MCC3323106.1 acyl-CoA dehydrogenase family protein [Gordonia bronchialis]QGS25858.1 acyl-CoA oxidase [Gordonia bronchialis]STQ63135.1 Acyl-CoA dehydrogenase, short-chain specific [Gordonia bronchialis]
MSTPTESPASDAARTPDVPVTPPDVSADDELSADERALLVENLRYTLDGRWRAVRDTVREQSNRSELLPDPSRTLDEARSHTLGVVRELSQHGFASAGFASDHGGTGDVGASITSIEMLGYADLSLMVKAGVQWGLFGGAVENLGTARHHERYVKGIIDLDVLGCFAMTETGHGSNVQALETTATYDRDTREFVIHSTTPGARKDYIGGAAEHARYAAVFAQLITAGPGAEPESQGVHCFVVPIRDEDGNDLPGITTSDCGYKGGLAGVDNGRIVFDNVRIPAENLLNRYADVEPDGTYTSPIENPNRRFFTMLGTLIRGRVSVAATAGAAGRKALTLATRYGLMRKQFEAPDETDEIIVMDYLGHQRKLLPLIAKSYAIACAQNEITAELHEVQSSSPDDSDAGRQRQLESDAAGLKAYATWHASHAVNVSREACGGAGYLDENQLSIIRGDIDVFTTFEGDNTVMTQLVAKELLSSYADDVQGLSAGGWVRFVVEMARDVVAEKTAVRQVVQTLLESSDEDTEKSNLTNRGTQIRLFRNREDHLIRTCAQRLRRALDDDNDAFEVFNNAQDHLLKVGRAHTERVVLEAFIEAINDCDSRSAAELLGKVCDLFVYSALEDDLGWFLMHRHISVERAKAIRRGVNTLCQELRPHARTLVDAFGIPENLLAAPMLEHG